MIIRRKLFEKYENYKFNISYGYGDRVLVKSGENIKVGTQLIEKRASTVKYSFFLPEQIDTEIKDLYKYVNWIDGELVSKGDILAQRTVAGGLNIKKLLSPAQGVVDLSRLDKGFLGILGEESEMLMKSKFNGYVENVNPIDGINVVTDSYALDILSISDNVNDENKKLVGEITVLGEGNDLKLSADDLSYEDKIVFVGKYLHPDLLQDLFEKGALFVLTYSMDYEDFRRQGLPVGVIGGFGEIHSSKSILSEIAGMKDSFAVVDYSESQIFFISGNQSRKQKSEIFVKSLVGSSVLSRSLYNYGMIGVIQDIEDGVFATVQWEAGQRSMVNIGNLEFISL